MLGLSQAEPGAGDQRPGEGLRIVGDVLIGGHRFIGLAIGGISFPEPVIGFQGHALFGLCGQKGLKSGNGVP